MPYLPYTIQITNYSSACYFLLKGDNGIQQLAGQSRSASLNWESLAEFSIPSLEIHSSDGGHDDGHRSCDKIDQERE